MLNLALGTSVEEGRSCILTERGNAGHAVYGPYEFLDPGSYVVEYHLELADSVASSRDLLVAVLDVVRNVGKEVIARKEVRLSQLRAGPAQFKLRFDLAETSNLEYRVWVPGRAALLIDEYRRVTRIPDDGAALPESSAFPGPEADALPFFAENRGFFRSLYEQHFGVDIVDGSIILTTNGIALHASSRDDLNFVGEIFAEQAYNFTLGGETCVIDIGMNIGLASLSFAAKPEVVEVHAFEPFASTYDRALENLALNPTLAAKITAHNVGLSDHDWSGDIVVAPGGDSGSQSTVGATAGTAVFAELRDAPAVLAPIIAAARAAGRKVIVKVDCEGSEFAIFEALERAELFGQIDGFMVEWHALFVDKSKRTLFAPLQRNGFIIFDRSPPVGNGFFYAARLPG